MCNDSQFVFNDPVAADDGDTTYGRHTYMSNGFGCIVDSVEVRFDASSPYIYCRTNFYKIKDGTDSTYEYLSDYGLVIRLLKKGIINKTIGVYAPHGEYLGSIRIIEFTKP
jgi:hypothetical protein